MIKDKIAVKNDVDFDYIKSFFKNENVVVEDDSLKIIWKDKYVTSESLILNLLLELYREADTYKNAEELINNLKEYRFIKIFGTKKTKTATKIKLKISDLAFGGKGISKLDDMVFFVKDAIPNQTVNVK